jgi:hypothetical protein
MLCCAISTRRQTAGGPPRRSGDGHTYSVDLGDIQAVADSDGKLVDLVLHPDATAHYTHGELAERMNIAFAALRAEVEGDYQARYGGEIR